MRNYRKVIAALTLIALFSVLACPVMADHENATGNPAHGDDWGGPCPGEGNWGSGNPGVEGPTSASAHYYVFVVVW